MKILITGASGFIASQIVTDLLAAGHSVTCCVRDISFTKQLFPTANHVRCDFINDTTSEHWIDRLENIDAVINCVGIFYHPNKKVTWAIHYDAPRALFDACVKKGINRIIQISALGIDKSDTDYAKSKKAIEDYLLSLPVNATVLRPSLVYGRGSYGGTSLFRGLAGLPWVTPVPGKGAQEFQPIHLEDLSKAVKRLLEVPPDKSILLSAVSAKRIALKEVLIKMRAWLGFAKSKIVFIPFALIRLGTFVGDLIPYSAMNSTAYKMLMQNNITSSAESQKFYEQIGFVPRDFDEGISRQPSSVQDRWHARLFFLRPLLQLSIAFIWIFTAVCCLFLYPKASSYALLANIGVSSFWQPILFYGSCLIDAVLGFSMLVGFKLRKVCLLQIMIILVYTAIISWKLPTLWLEPFAPIAKNIPFIMTILIFLALESER